jgi:hypothetical protein
MTSKLIVLPHMGNRVIAAPAAMSQLGLGLLIMLLCAKSSFCGVIWNPKLVDLQGLKGATEEPSICPEA